MQNGQPPEYLTVQEVSRKYRRTERTIRRWVREHKLPFIRVQGRGLLFPREEIEALFAQGRGAPMTIKSTTPVGEERP